MYTTAKTNEYEGFHGQRVKRILLSELDYVIMRKLWEENILDVLSPII